GDQRREPLREPLFESSLQRVIAGEYSVFHPLNISEGRKGSCPRGLRTIRIRKDRALVDIAEAWELRPFVSDVCNVEQEIAEQFSLNSEVILLNVCGSLKRILRTA